MRSHVKCSVCNQPIDAELGERTKRGEFEYRYSSHHMLYFEPGTDDRHVCKLVARRVMYPAGPSEEWRSEPIAIEEIPPVPEAPPEAVEPPQVARPSRVQRGGVRFDG